MSLGTLDPLIDSEELRFRLSVSQATIERWTASKIIPSYKFGSRCVRYDYTEVRSALSKFEIPAYRRLPRGPFAHRRKPSREVVRWVQAEFALTWEDPSQLLLPLQGSDDAPPQALLPIAPQRTRAEAK
jgi:hypothetical protein